MTITDILERIETAAARLGIAPATLTQRAVGNSRLPARLKAGGSVSLRTVERLERWIDAALAEAAE